MCLVQLTSEVPDFVFSASWAAAMPIVRALQVTGHSMLVHAVGLRLCVVRHVAVLGVAVGTVHPCAFRVLIHCRDVKVLVAV